MPGIFFQVKDPTEVLTYTFDWATEMGSDTISSVAWNVPAGVTQSAVMNTTTTASIRVSGGTLGQLYEIQCRPTGQGGQQYEKTLHLLIENK